MVARSRGVDILTLGSGNPGTSNVTRVLGAKWGALVFLLDALKGAVPALVGLALGTRPGAYILVTAAVLGHMFPITRRFRGGKGVATMSGAMIVLHPVISVVLSVVWFVTRKLSGKASLASLVITVGLPVAVAISGAPAWEIVYVLGLCALVLLRHVDNIRRLIGRQRTVDRTWMTGSGSATFDKALAQCQSRTRDAVEPTVARTLPGAEPADVRPARHQPRRRRPPIHGAAHRVLRQAGPRRMRGHRDRGRQRARQRLAVRAGTAGPTLRRRVERDRRNVP